MLFGLSFAKLCVVMDKSKLISMAPMMEILEDKVWSASSSGRVRPFFENFQFFDLP